jgi:hypothetical protein
MGDVEPEAALRAQLEAVEARLGQWRGAAGAADAARDAADAALAASEQTVAPSAEALDCGEDAYEAMSEEEGRAMLNAMRRQSEAADAKLAEATAALHELEAAAEAKAAAEKAAAEAKAVAKRATDAKVAAEKAAAKRSQLDELGEHKAGLEASITKLVEVIAELEAQLRVDEAKAAAAAADTTDTDDADDAADDASSRAPKAAVSSSGDSDKPLPTDARELLTLLGEEIANTPPPEQPRVDAYQARVDVLRSGVRTVLRRGRALGDEAKLRRAALETARAQRDALMEELAAKRSELEGAIRAQSLAEAKYSAKLLVAGAGGQVGAHSKTTAEGGEEERAAAQRLCRVLFERDRTLALIKKHSSTIAAWRFLWSLAQKTAKEHERKAGGGSKPKAPQVMNPFG